LAIEAHEQHLPSHRCCRLSANVEMPVGFRSSPAHQPQRRPAVAATLDQHVEDLALVIDGTPEVHSLAGDPNNHLVQVPSIARAGGHMSAIASFYVVPAERLNDVVTAATAAPGGWFRPARDTFWSVVRRAGRELETFAWSGWVFNTLDLYLESRHASCTPISAMSP
jgi:hypothetical protein